jgi:lipopolysaccharide transport system ATP-binding protein
LYQVEAICDRAIWLDKGFVKLDGAPANVVSAYTDAIALENAPVQKNPTATTPTSTVVAEGTARITEATVSIDGVNGRQLDAISRQSELCVTVAFVSDLGLLTPSVGLMVVSGDGQAITSAGTQHDGLIIQRDTQGQAKVRVRFAQLALLKGEYRVDVYLLCENAIHVYDKAEAVAVFKVRQHGLEQGVVSLPRQWTQI